MVSNLALAGIAAAMVLSAGAPFAVFLVCHHRMHLLWRNILVGMGVFFVFALLLEQTLHYVVLKANPTTVMWISSNPWNYVVYALLAAGLFEEIGRYLGMRLLVKPSGNPGTAVAYGLGHGGLESVIVGALPQLQVFMLGIALNQGRFDVATAGSLPPAQAEGLRHLLETLTFGGGFYGGVERLAALMIQILFSLLVWKAVSERRIVFLGLAILAHIAFDLPAAMYQAGLMPLWQVQIAMIASLVAVLAYYLMHLPKRIAPAPAPA